MDIKELLLALVLRGPNHGRATLTADEIRAAKGRKLEVFYDGVLYTLEAALDAPHTTPAPDVPGVPSPEQTP